MRNAPLRLSRRAVLTQGTALAGAVAIAGPAGILAAQIAPTTASATAGPEVTPVEDLMREHGVLRRVMFAFDEARARLGGAKDWPFQPIADGADVIAKFIQDYHEKLEEDHIFPLFEKARKLADLTTTLRIQHKAGRETIARVKALATADAIADADKRKELAERLAGFNRMYRPHAAREDTVLLPALHLLVTDQEYDKMGDLFEDKEQELFGKDGFESVVGQVARIETALGIADLGSFTPQA
jgi:hemerythrin-like domain-containing protein